MAHRFAIELYRGGEFVDHVAPEGGTSVTVSLRPSGESSVVVDLDPTDLSLAVPGGDTEWEAYFVRWTHAGVRTPTRLMSGGLVRAAEYQVQYKPPDTAGLGGGVFPVRRATILDRFRAFRDVGPGEEVRRTNSDSHAELAYVASQAGLVALPSLPPVSVPEIIYGRDTGYWGPFEPYVSPWSPIPFIDPDSGILQLVDTTELSGEVVTSGFALERRHYNPATFSVNREERATQAKIIYVDFAGGDGVSPVPTDVERKTRTRTLEDGSQSTEWREFGYLHENPDRPDERTREVLLGEGQSTTAPDGTPLFAEESRRSYRRDFTEHFRTVTSVSAQADLPGAGRDFRRTSTTIENREWIDDPDVPGRRVLDRVTRITTGLYVYVYIEGVPFDELRKTAKPVRPATHAGIVDSSSQASQRWSSGQISTWVEHYERMPGARQVIRWGYERDDLREQVIDDWREPELGDTAVDPSSRQKTEYYPETIASPTKRAIVIDATKVGRDLGRQVAARRISQTAPVIRINLTLTRPDYSRLRLGWYVPLASDAPGGLSGVYLITAVTFTAGPPFAGRANVTQSLELYRAW